MKYLLSTFFAFVFCMTAAISYAKPGNSDANRVILYQTPAQSSKVVAKLDPMEQLVPIFAQKGWVKVGVLKDGTVGWVNLPDYHKVVDNYYKQQIKSIYVSAIKSGDNGKEQIVAYKNGKKITGKDATVLYEKVKQEQSQMDRQMLKTQVEMDRVFRHMWYNFDNRPQLPLMPRFPITRPLVVVIKSGS